MLVQAVGADKTGKAGPHDDDVGRAGAAAAAAALRRTARVGTAAGAERAGDQRRSSQSRGPGQELPPREQTRLTSDPDYGRPG